MIKIFIINGLKNVTKISKNLMSKSGKTGQMGKMLWPKYQNLINNDNSKLAINFSE